MEKKYCLLNNNEIFVKAYNRNELSEIELNKTVYTFPPKIKEGLVALWQNDSWYIRRKQPGDSINLKELDSMMNEMNYTVIEENIKNKNTIVQQRSGKFVTNSELLDLLTKEHKKYKKIIVDLTRNKKKVPKIFRDYMKELISTIEEKKKISDMYITPNLRYHENDKHFDLCEILENKFEADMVFEESLETS